MTRALLVAPRGAARPQIALRNRVGDLLRGRLDLFADRADRRERFPPLGLLTVAGLLPNHFHIELCDEEAGDDAAVALARGSFDLMMVSMMNDGALRGVELAALARARGVATVCGGYYPSAVPERLAPRFDAVVTGEAEDTVPALLADLAAGRPLRPRYTSRGDNPPESWPAPRFDLIGDPARYSDMPLQATRGCAGGCSFCAIAPLFGRAFRAKPPERVAGEAAALARLAPRHPLSFADENLALAPAYAAELAAALAPLRRRFEAYADLSIADHPGLLDRLAAAGLYRLQVGLESLDPETLAEISPRKAAMLPEYEQRIAAIHAAGIEVVGMFIVGFDRDTRATFAAIDAFCARTRLASVNIEWLTPVPGTAAYDRLAAEGRILPDAWEREETVSFVPKNLTPAALQALTVWLAWRHAAPERVADRRAWFKRIKQELAGRTF